MQWIKKRSGGRRGKKRQLDTPADGRQDEDSGALQEEMRTVKVVVEITADPLKLLSGQPREIAQVRQEEEAKEEEEEVAVVVVVEEEAAGGG